jgi:ketosteroid isomerase-like protein
MIVMDRLDETQVAAHVRRVFLERAAFDYDAFGLAIAGDAIYRIAGDPKVTTLPGEIRGRKAIISAFRQIDVDFELADYHVDEIMAEGQTAIVRWSCHLTCRNTGHATPLSAICWVRLDDQMRLAECLDVLDNASVVAIGSPA